MAYNNSLQNWRRSRKIGSSLICLTIFILTTDIFGRGIDMEKVNIVINYDMPDCSDTYLHRVGRAGRFGTKGLTITFVSSEEDEKVMKEVQSRFEVKVPELPEHIDVATYSIDLMQ